MTGIFWLSWLATVWLLSAYENGAGAWTARTSFIIAAVWLAVFLIGNVYGQARRRRTRANIRHIKPLRRCTYQQRANGAGYNRAVVK